MSFATQFHVPGAFNFDPSTRPGQPLHANVFRPPPSPSSSSYNLAKSTGSLFSDISMSNAQPIGMAKRKRASTRESTPMDWNMAMEGANDGREEEKSREIRYTLAGQISTTPGAATVGADNGLLDESVYSDVDYRRDLGPKMALEPDSPSGQIPGRTEGNVPSQGWSLFSTIGDMVGKVWEFCRNGAFQGFHAGGGKGYNVNGSTVTETTGRTWNPELNTPIYPTGVSSMNQGVPEYFPQQPLQPQIPYSPMYHDISTPESTPQPAAKRRQVSASNDELRNWVVVDEPNGQQPRRFAAEVKAAARPSGLARPRPGYYSQTSASSHRRINAPSPRFTGGTPTLPRAPARPSLRVSNVGSPSLPPREPASFASPRSSPASNTTPSRIPAPVQAPSHNPNPYTFPATAAATSTSAKPISTTTTLKSSASRPSSRQSATGPVSRQSIPGSASRQSATRPTSRQSQSARHSLSSITTNIRPLSPTKSVTSNSHRRSNSSVTRRQSLLSPPRPLDSTAAATAASPAGEGSSPSRLDAEARQLAQRRVAAERDADAKVDAFNARLLSMIRQGREALGTRVDVEMDATGGGGGGRGGWEDDD